MQLTVITVLVVCTLSVISAKTRVTTTSLVKYSPELRNLENNNGGSECGKRGVAAISKYNDSCKNCSNPKECPAKAADITLTPRQTF